MQTGLTLESDSYNSTDRSIANKLYLYDNDTENETADKKHTRLVIGAEYKGTKGYYPVDFEDTDADKLIKSYGTRSTYSSNSADGPGYTDRKQPPSQPSVHINVNIIEWDMNGRTDWEQAAITTCGRKSVKRYYTARQTLLLLSA